MGKVLSLILDQTVQTLSVALPAFLKAHVPNVTSYTKPSFSEAQLKVDPQAFVHFTETILRVWYESWEHTTVLYTRS